MVGQDFLSLLLFIHIIGGSIALLSGLAAIFTVKGSAPHRLSGKIYFGGMTAVFVGAVVVALAHQNYFLLMVGFFSYYMTVRGYRILYLKNPDHKQKIYLVDVSISIVASVFVGMLVWWGVRELWVGQMMGVVGIVFGGIGLSLVISDVQKIFNPPSDRMHWWYGHISSMGGSYIAAITAFVVVNIQLPQFQWVLWILPSVVGSIIIGQTIRFYRKKFAS
jgi:hypothetical protein